MFACSNPLVKAQATAFLLLCISNLLMFIALLTPSWQVAEDTDAHRYVQSGLWMYCPGGVPCWYIFSDNLINYYEKVDICRFLLIGDCRKKLIRTPYFFGWHYAVLILLLLALIFGLIAASSLGISFIRASKVRLLTVVSNIFTFLSFLFLSVALAVFMVNAEMLESRFLIGIKNTFKKEYGYSFYFAGLACMFLMFCLLAGVMAITYLFFTKNGHNYVEEAKLKNAKHMSSWLSFHSFNKNTEQWPNSQKSPHPTIPIFEHVFEQPPRPGTNTISQSVTPLPPEHLSTTKTCLSH